MPVQLTLRQSSAALISSTYLFRPVLSKICWTFVQDHEPSKNSSCTQRHEKQTTKSYKLLPWHISWKFGWGKWGRNVAIITRHEIWPSQIWRHAVTNSGNVGQRNLVIFLYKYIVPPPKAGQTRVLYWDLFGHRNETVVWERENRKSANTPCLNMIFVALNDNQS
jgi:hypothetical protein